MAEWPAEFRCRPRGAPSTIPDLLLASFPVSTAVNPDLNSDRKPCLRTRGSPSSFVCPRIDSTDVGIPAVETNECFRVAWIVNRAAVWQGSSPRSLNAVARKFRDEDGASHSHPDSCCEREATSCPALQLRFCSFSAINDWQYHGACESPIGGRSRRRI